MNEERWRQVEEVFHRAADLPAAGRDEFLSTACAGDTELRHEVESLLANDDSGDNLVAKAVSEASAELPEESGDGHEDLVGKSIGPYLVTELIGKGGMGLVFKALDKQLNRSVAIKALPADRLADPERKRRFLQEARATSALNHPNIVTVHGITQHEGTDFMVMEYVSGKTLDRVIPARGLPVKVAVKYGLDIADAVTAAHAGGIVHRDIKPSNVMVTDKGRVKVLDFGLAKLVEAEQSAERGLIEPSATKTGMVFGTAGYMSPEQAEGKPADARSDIFSFGALLYEMLTGKRAFPGQNVISILAAVINSEPAPLAVALPNAPRELEWITSRCLKKDPERRIQHMVDVKIALEDVQDRVDLPSPAAPVLRSRSRWLVPAAVAVLMALALGAWASLRLLPRKPISFQRLTFRQGDVLRAKFAPAGNIVYAAAWDGASPRLFTVQPGDREARDLELPSANIQSVSSLGEMAILIGGGDARTFGTLARVPLSGGVPRAVLENVWAADWSPDGKSLAVIRTENGHHRVEFPIGSVLYETQALRPPIELCVAPRDDMVAFFAFTENGDYAVNIVGPGRPARILSRGWRAVGGAQWSPNGKEIWFGGARLGADEALWAVDLAGRERMLAQIPGSGVLYDVTRDGRLLLANADSRIGLRALGPGAKAERDLAWLDASAVSDLSRDGTEVLFGELSSGEGRNAAIYLRRTDGSPAVRLGYGNRASLSPDAKWVACVRRDRDTSRLVLLPTGPGEEKVLATGGIAVETVEWFADGKRLLFSGSQSEQPPRTYLLDLDSGNIKTVTSPGVRASAVSPDGRFAAIITEGKLRLHALDNGRDVVVGRVESGIGIIRWSDDGRHLFVQRALADRRGMTILRLDVQTGTEEVWRELKLPDPTALFYGSVRISGDGKSYAFSFQRDLATLYLVSGVK